MTKLNPTAPPRGNSIEFYEGRDDYADGVDGHAATPYEKWSQEMTDWFAGWVSAKNEDRALDTI